MKQFNIELYNVSKTRHYDRQVKKNLRTFTKNKSFNYNFNNFINFIKNNNKMPTINTTDKYEQFLARWYAIKKHEYKYKKNKFSQKYNHFYERKWINMVNSYVNKFYYTIFNEK
jgi:hypothetical protein